MEAIYPLFSVIVIYLVIAVMTRSAKKAVESRKKPAAAAPAATDARAPRTVEDSRPRELQPTVHVTEHDDSVYTGSLNAVTGEGYDPCHEEQLKPLTRAETIEPAPAAAPGLQLRWTGDEIVRGFVVSEILKRKGA